MKALLFPGQSSQFSGMTIDLYEKFDEVKQIFHDASDIAGFNIKDVILGDVDKLNQTEYLQIAIFVSSLSCFKVLQIKEKIKLNNVKYLLGHSLGEYIALCIANSISFEDSIKILKKRSQLMANANKHHVDKKLAMASVLGADLKTVSHFLDKFFSKNHLQKDLFIANYNSSTQIVLSGNLETLEEFKKFTKDDLRKIVNLPVSSAFHSPFMKESSIEFSQFLENFTINDSEIKIIMNANAVPENKHEKIRENLIKNFHHGVLWQPSIEYAIKNGVSKFIQIGGKEILINMIKKENMNNIELYFANSIETINNFH